MNRRDLFFWPVYPADMLADPYLARLSPEAIGAFFRLCLHAWRSNASLPDNETELRRLAGCHSARQWQRIWGAIARFLQQTARGYEIPELSACYMEQQKKYSSNREKARKMAEARWRVDATSNPASNAPSIANRPESDKKVKKNLERREGAKQEQSSLPHTEENMSVSSAKVNKQDPKPDEARITRIYEGTASMSPLELVRYALTADKQSSISPEIEEATMMIPEDKIRRLCVESLAYAEVNHATTKDKARVLTDSILTLAKPLNGEKGDDVNAN